MSAEGTERTVSVDGGLHGWHASLALCAGTSAAAGLAAGAWAPGLSVGRAAAVVLVYSTQGVAGAWIARALERTGDPRTPTERLARALLLGPLALAAQMLLMAAIGLPFDVATVVAPWWALVLVTVMRARSRPPAAKDTAPATGRGVDVAGGAGETAARASERHPGGRARMAVLLLAGVLVVVSLAIGLQMPVHTGDAMNNYALNARVFETHRGLAPHASALLAVPGHTENPPLVALNEALVFLAAGSARAWAIKPFFSLAYAALLLLVIEACWRTLPASRAAAVALFALFTPIWAGQSADGYVDLRLTASVLLLALEGRALWRVPCGRRTAAFVAAALACAALKHEGVALAGLACALPLLLALRRRLPAARAAATVAVLAALALAWPLWAARHLASPLPLVGPAWHDLGRALARLPEVIARLAALTADTDAHGHSFWGLFWPAALALAFVGLLRPARRVAVLAVLAALTAHAGLYVLVFALTPADLEWHVLTAGTRLVVHLSPWALLAMIAALQPAGTR